MRTSLLLIVALLSLHGCGAPPPPEWRADGAHRWRPLRIDRGSEPGFTSISARRSGVEFRNTLDPETALENEHLLVGSGVALGDVNGDGLADLYLARLEGPNALYLNRGGWRFEETAGPAGVALDDRFSTGAAIADLDGDGDLDLVVTSLGGPDAIFLNDGSGVFSEVAESGLIAGLGSTTPALADVDGDGDLDLYVTAYKAVSASDELGLLERPMTDIIGGTTDSLTVAPGFREHYRVELRDGREIVAEQADPDRLYLNDGTGRFAPVSWTGGAFLDAAGRPLERDLDDFGLAARFYDVNGDGHPDLYLCNDFDDPDQLWLGRDDGTFQAVPATALRTTPHASMSVDFADLDRDGSVEIFVAEMRPRSHRRWLRQVPFQRRLLKPIGQIDDRPQVQRNALFTPLEGAGWSEISQMAGVDASEWSWTSLFLDVDLDGYEDLLIANGYSRDTQSGDIVDEISALQGQATTRELKRLYPPLLNRNAAFRNRGDLTFEEVGEAWSFGTEADISHGMATADLDGDGDLDVVVNRLGESALLLRNDASAPRVAVRLRGRGANTAGVGATVRLVADGLPTQERQLTAGGLYLSSAEALVTFAFPEGDGPARLEVDWPDRSRSVLDGVRADRLYEIRQGGSEAETTVGEGTVDGTPTPARASHAIEDDALFRDATDLLAHIHPERAFEDFFVQPLLPFQISRLGPGISWVDLDRDGDADLVVPPGAGGRLAWLRNDGDRFRSVPLEADESDVDRTAAIALPGPGGAPILIVGQSNFEARDAESARSLPAALAVARDGTLPRAIDLSLGLSGAGPLAAADLDGDDTLELFVGGRSVRGAYPISASSALLREVDGAWRRDTPHDSLLTGVGMVSGAVFVDLDGDADPDLLLATEWGPVRLLLNEGGRLEDATAAWGLDALEGRWNGIASGDFDGDGRLDIVVTGWGRNLRFRPTPARPISLFHGDFDGNGSWDVVPARNMKNTETLVPLTGYDQLRRAIPSLRARIPDFDTYAEASIVELLGTREPYGRRATLTDHLVLMNRGDHFEAIPLPAQAQRAPSLGVAVGDFDGDGREDLFLAQNFFPTPPHEPRHDGGVGLVLLGEGDGTFTPLSPARSGVVIHGDQRGVALADFDGDARLDLAVAQNGSATRLFRNAGAAPGLRVRLEGPEGNPYGVGAVIRIAYPDGTLGPAREVTLGSGYWSMDDPVQILGVRSRPAEVVVRWPGGGESRLPVPDEAREVVVTRPGG
ncbi:MAG: FG-GAP-like repeat-containing protein [Longimicrobiales bacterium]|nr:FG-GAP-like repeat-containing protein [Longimicrobiales bacterium]